MYTYIYMYILIHTGFQLECVRVKGRRFSSTDSPGRVCQGSGFRDAWSLVKVPCSIPDTSSGFVRGVQDQSCRVWEFIRWFRGLGFRV